MLQKSRSTKIFVRFQLTFFPRRNTTFTQFYTMLIFLVKIILAVLRSMNIAVPG